MRVGDIVQRLARRVGASSAFVLRVSACDGHAAAGSRTGRSRRFGSFRTTATLCATAMVVSSILSAPVYGLSPIVYTIGTPVGPGQCTHDSIQAAIDAAPSNDQSALPVIHVTRTLSHDAQAIRVNRFYQLRIEGGYATCDQAIQDGQLTTVSGAGGLPRPVLDILEDTVPGHIVLDHLMITGGDVDANGKGGGINFLGRDTATLEINDSVISNNMAGYGGGIYAEGEGYWTKISMTNVTIVGNTARHDGGGLVADQVNLFSDSSLIAFNKALGEPANDGIVHGYGGGVYGRAGPWQTLLVLRPGYNSLGSVYGNEAVYGGGVAIDGYNTAASADTQAYLDLQHAEIVGNFASAKGGGIYLKSFSSEPSNRVDAVVALKDASFIDNAAPEGAAVLFGGSGSDSLTTTKIACPDDACINLFEGNVAQDSGGAFTAGAVIKADAGTTAIEFDTTDGVVVRGNRGGSLVRMTGAGGQLGLDNALVHGNNFSQALVQQDGGSLTLLGATIAGNTIAGMPLLSTTNAEVSIQSSILWQPGKTMLARSGGSQVVGASIASEVASLGAGATSNDPQFVDPAHDDFRLRAASPGVDAAPDSSSATDALGQSRLVDLPIVANRNGNGGDIGALERQDLRPLLLNGDFDFSDLRQWTHYAGSWDGSQNASGGSGSGAWSYGGTGLTQDRVILGAQCTHLPGPGSYLLDGWGHGGGGTIQSRDYAVVAWEFRRDGTAACSNGAADAAGQVTLGAGTNWGHPAQPVAMIDVPPGDWTTNSSITLTLVALDGGITSPHSISAWFDGVALIAEAGDGIFFDGFE
jgi:hypothetical protein